MYRLRHDIRYLFLKFKLNRHKFRNILNPREYTYSAFVSCDRIDARKFVIRKLLPNLETEETNIKFCVAQRNFMVGVTIIDNIMRAIDKSRKVIFIISKAFLKSGWCKEELRIAHRVCSFSSILILKPFNCLIVKCNMLKNFISFRCLWKEVKTSLSVSFMPDIKQDELPSTLRP